MFTNELSGPLEGLMKLAYVGMVSIALAVFVGIPLLLFWLWNHVSISFH